MTFSELIQEVKKHPSAEIRFDNDHRFEFVVTVHTALRLQHALEEYFGFALKPASKAPDQAAKSVARNFGGIRKDQTLYCREEDDQIHLAMIWPWSDGQTATVKIFNLTK